MEWIQCNILHLLYVVCVIYTANPRIFCRHGDLCNQAILPMCHMSAITVDVLLTWLFESENWMSWNEMTTAFLSGCNFLMWSTYLVFAAEGHSSDRRWPTRPPESVWSPSLGHGRRVRRQRWPWTDSLQRSRNTTEIFWRSGSITYFINTSSLSRGVAGWSYFTVGGSPM